MHTPAGHEMKDGIAYPVDWLAIMFNPSFPYRFAHMFTAAYLTTSLVVLSVGARYLMSNRYHRGSQNHGPHGPRNGGGTGAFAAGDRRRPWPKHRASISPPKSRRWKATGMAPNPQAWFCSAGPTRRPKKITLKSLSQISPALSSPTISNGLFKGLKDFKPEDRPPVLPVFFAFRVMVGAWHADDRDWRSSARFYGCAARCSKLAGICGH